LDEYYRWDFLSGVGLMKLSICTPRVPVAFPKQVVNQFKNNNNIEYDDLIQNGKSEKSKKFTGISVIGLLLALEMPQVLGGYRYLTS
jgi:hypothetical protein